jgi:hypothetical protein
VAGTTVTVSDSSTRTLTVACTGGKKVIGGGYTASNAGILHTNASGPANDSSWVVVLERIVLESGSSTVTPYAICITAL